MARFRNVNLIEQLSVALASGLSVRQAADRLGVALPTAYRWRLQAPGFKARVESHRRVLVKHELEKIASHAALRMSLPARQENVRLPEPLAVA